jgi:hypothetical protein
MFTQLNPTIPVIVTSKNNAKGQAFACIDYGIEHNLIWVTALDEDGSVWCVPNPEIRFQFNWSVGRRKKPE